MVTALVSGYIAIQVLFVLYLAWCAVRELTR